MTTINTITEAPAVTLSNGLRVANFSSPHPFNFVDGSVLPSCDEARSRALSMDRSDEESPWAGPLVGVSAPITAVTPVFVLTDEVIGALQALEETWDIDIVLVPFPVLQALRDRGSLPGSLIHLRKVGTVIMADRIAKTAAIDKFGR